MHPTLLDIFMAVILQKMVHKNWDHAWVLKYVYLVFNYGTHFNPNGSNYN